MSNSAFIGELNSRLDPATTRQVAAAAIDFGQFGTIGDNIMGFQLIPMRETWNMVVAPTQQNATEDVQILQAAQGLIRFTEDSGAILGDMNLLIVDDIDNPTLRVRYEGTFEGTLVKQVSC